MKAKVIYIIATAALTLSAFFIGKFTAPTVIKTETPTVLQTDNSDMLNMNTVTDFEATKTGLMLIQAMVTDIIGKNKRIKAKEV